MQVKNVKSEISFSADKMQKVNLFETQWMFADVYCLEPGQEQKRHSHNGADKIYYVLEGTGRSHISGVEAHLDPNQIVLAPADVEDGVRNDSTDRVVLLVFMAPNPNKK